MQLQVRKKKKTMNSAFLEAVVELVGVQNLTFRGISSNELTNALRISFQLGQENSHTAKTI